MSKQVFIRLVCLIAIVFATAIVSSTYLNSEPTANAQQPAAEKTVEQLHKNIQVLQGMPESQLVPTMNFMSASLGVRCNFCHVNKAGTWDFVSDEKPEKGTAREMIKMVLGVNKNTFKGATEVSCFSCHRGKTRVVGIPPLPIPAVANVPAVANEASSGPKPAAPTVDEILARYIQSVGGLEAIDKAKTRTMKGTYVLANGDALPYEVYQAAPNQMHSKLTTKNVGLMEQVFDGTNGWVKNDKGEREITGGQLADLKRVAQFYRDTKLREQFSRVNAAGKDTIDGKDVYVVRATADNHRERLFFDAQTGLLVRRINYTETMIGVIPQQIDYSDYRDVEGVKMPFTIQVASVDPFETATRKITEIKINAPVDPALFKKP